MADIGTAYVRVAPNMTGIQGKIASGFKGTGSKVANGMGSEISGRSAAIVGAIAGIASAAASKAMSMISSSIGGAIKRVDTLNNAARTFEFMGFKAEDAQKATSDLERSIDGLPTPLDSAMRGMSSLAATYGDIGKGQKVFSALNNAILGFGGTADQVDGSINQLSQLPLDGPLDAQTWNSLRANGLTPLFVAMAKESGKSVNELKEAFGSGELTVGDFNDMLLKMNKEGGGGLASLENIAQSATSGIGTSWERMQISITRGIAKIIDSIGSENIAAAFDVMRKAIDGVFTFIADNLPKAISTVKEFVDFIARNKDVFGPLAAGIGAVVAAITAWKIALGLWSAVTKTATAIQAAFNIVMSLNPIGIIILAVIALVAALVYFFTQTETGKAIMQSFGNVVSAVWNGIKTGLQAVGSFFSTIWNGIKDVIGGVINWIKSNWPKLLAIITGPIGMAVLAVVSHWDKIKAAFISAWNLIKGVWGRVIGFYRGVWNGIRSVFAGVAGFFRNIFSAAWNAVTNIWSRVGGFFRGIFNNIKNALSGMASVGKNVVQGLWNGISGMGNWLKDKIVGFVKDKIPGPVRKALGISSPSKVFAGFGRDINRGLALGIEKNTGVVTNAVDSLTSSTINGMAGPLVNPSVAFGSVPGASLGSGGNNTSNQSVHIDKLVLASEGAVKEFFRELNRDTINIGMGMTPNQGATA